jgi:beta-lactamase regulating signal transducer with metallopeptidase domain
MNIICWVHPGAGLATWIQQVFLTTAILVALAAGVARLTGRHRPTVRHGVWMVTLILVLATPFLAGFIEHRGWTLVAIPIAPTTRMPARDVLAANVDPRQAPRPLVSEHGEAVPAASRPDLVSGPAINQAPNRELGPTLQARSNANNASVVPVPASLGSAPERRHSLWDFAAAVWISGGFLLILRTVIGWASLRRAVRQATFIDPVRYRLEVNRAARSLSLEELPPIVLSGHVQSPGVAGLVRPSIILPAAVVQGMHPQELVATLIHEFAHIKRRDQWMLLLQRLALVVFWPHPLVYYLNRELDGAREEVCDNHVLAESRPTEYAETLLRLAGACLRAPKWGTGLAMFRRRHQLEARIRHLLDKQQDRKTTLGGVQRVALVALMAVLVGAVSAIRVVSAFPNNSASQAEPSGSATRSEARAVTQAEKEKERDEINRRVTEIVRSWKKFHSVSTNELVWTRQVRELVQVGKPAVPALIAALDATEEDSSLRLLGFTLRALGDPRAVPALIRAIPKTLRPPGSDLGMNLEDQELLEFMQQNDLRGGSNRGAYFDLGRPVREISGALQKLTGTTLGEQELFFTFLDGGERQRDMQRQLYDRVAQRWADWWKLNWQHFVEDRDLAEVRLPSLKKLMNPGRFRTGPNVKATGGYAEVVISPVEERRKECLLDLDTNRLPNWPKALSGADGKGVSVDVLCAWAAREGVDLIGMEFRAPGSDKAFYCLRGVGLQAWEIPNERWDKIEAEVRSNEPLALGQPAGDLLMHYDAEHACYLPSRKATFLFLTRDGTPGILRIVSQVTEVLSPTSDSRPSIVREETSGNQPDASGFSRGVKIEYRTFYTDNESSSASQKP